MPQGGLVDQLEDRRLCKAEALGSNPSKSTLCEKADLTLITQKDGLPVVAVQLKCNANVLVHLPSFWVGKGFDAGESTMVRLRPQGARV